MAVHFVSRAGGVVRSFLVLYLTQERQLSPTTAGAVVAAVGVGDIGSQLLGGWLGDRIGRRHTMLVSELTPEPLPHRRPTRLRPRLERPMNLPKIVSRDEWLAARKRLLAKEKDFTRARDRLNAERRRLPMVRIDKEYVFDGPDGKATCSTCSAAAGS